MTDTPDGVVPRRHTDETKQKIGNSRRGQKMPMESVAKMIDRVRANPPKGMLGKKHSPEAIEKMRQARLNRVVTPEMEAKRIEALRIAVKGKPKSPEHREKIRAGVLDYISKGGNAMNNTTMQNTLGERQIAEKLTALGINFQQQFLLNGRLHDFYLPDFNMVIEFDGRHHWDVSWFTAVHNRVAALTKQGLKDEVRNESVRADNKRIISIKGYNQPGDSHWGSFEEQMLNHFGGDIFPEDYDFTETAFDGDQEIIQHLRQKALHARDTYRKLAEYAALRLKP